MRNEDQWQASKFVYRHSMLRASRDSSEVAVSSRLVADAIAGCFGRYIPIYCFGNLLDLGCGKAPLYECYKAYVDHIVCVDWTHSLHQLAYVDVACNLGRPLPFQDEQFDTIILSDVLEHIPEPQNLWDEIKRIMRPGGKLLISVPFYYWLHESPHDYYRYTEYALRRFARQSGFEILVLEQYGGALTIISDILAKNIIKCHWRIGPLMAEYVQRLASWYVSRRRPSYEKLTPFPLGYFLVANKLGR